MQFSYHLLEGFSKKVQYSYHLLEGFFKKIEIVIIIRDGKIFFDVYYFYNTRWEKILNFLFFFDFLFAEGFF